jgi:signal transduction histidine kinase/ActR/RegA family two-component response regulator
LRLQTRLLILVAGAIVPLLVLSFVLSWLLVRQEVQTFRSGALDRNRAFMSAIDAELRGHITTLQALEALASLDSGNFATFSSEAERILKSQANWQNVLLASPSGEVLMSGIPRPASQPAGTADSASLREVVEKRSDVIGNVTYRDYLHAYGIAIRHPVIRNGSLVHVLSAIVDPRGFDRLIMAQDLPPGWVIGLVDSTGHFVARVPARGNAAVASPAFLAAVKQGDEGWYRGLTVENMDTFTAYKTSGYSRWSVGLAIPAATIYASAVSAAWTLGVGTLVTLLLASGFALWMSRRISAPISSLARSARAIGRGESVGHLDTEHIPELGDLALALREADHAIRERETLLEREQQALKAADRAKDEFLAMLGHELRNPMAAITSSVHVVSSAPRDSSMIDRAVAIIARQTRHMTRLVEDLLEISRLRLGKVVLHPEPFDLAQLAQRVVQVWEQAGRIAAGRMVLESSPVPVHADRARVEQVLSNLLDNAAKFSPPDQPIEIHVGRDGNDAVMRVTDHGTGIAPEISHQLFQLFVQGPQGADRSRGGMGLGLALVKRLVELHRGQVRALSEGTAKGATFEVRLPVADGTEALAEPPPPAPRHVACRILIVDDNHDGAEMLAAILGLKGHDVRVAHDAATGLARAAEWRPEVALLDIGLPDANGYELAAKLKSDARTRSIRLIAVTGYGQSADEKRALDSGFERHLTKPVDADLLDEVISEVCLAAPDSPFAPAGSSPSQRS